MLFFTADTHFYHKNVIKYCNRPFESVEQMNEQLIQNWNERVKPTDTTIIVGDFAFANEQKQLTLLRRLNGTKHLVKGNHDKVFPSMRDEKKGFASIRELYDFKPHHFGIKSDDCPSIVACHYAMRVWNKSHHGAWHVYGHSHGALPPHGKSWDVGVDNNNYYPIDFYELKAIVQQAEKVYHH